MYFSRSTKWLAMCVAMTLSAPVVAAELSGFEQPQLTLSDHAGLPFYPTETHVFADRSLELTTFSVAGQQIASTEIRTATPLHVTQDKAPAAVALRATVLRRSEDLVRTQTPQPAFSRNMLPTDIMDSWSVGVFR